MNTIKWDSYTLAWDRISYAKEKGCEIEVVAIAESLMSDRLYSFLKGQQDNTLKPHSNFFKKIEHTRNCLDAPVVVEIKAREGGSREDCSTQDLFRDVDTWRKKRNRVIHGIAHPEDPKTPMDATAFVKELKETALEGENLARMVIKWHGQALAEFLNNQKESDNLLADCNYRFKKTYSKNESNSALKADLLF